MSSPTFTEAVGKQGSSSSSRKTAWVVADSPDPAQKVVEAATSRGPDPEAAAVVALLHGGDLGWGKKHGVTPNTANRKGILIHSPGSISNGRASQTSSTTAQLQPRGSSHPWLGRASESRMPEMHGGEREEGRGRGHLMGEGEEPEGGREQGVEGGLRRRKGIKGSKEI